MTIEKAVQNTFDKIGIDYKKALENTDRYGVKNRFGFGFCETSFLVASLIKWVYRTSNDYELGIRDVSIADYDRVRYFIMEVDKKAYLTCLD